MVSHLKTLFPALDSGRTWTTGAQGTCTSGRPQTQPRCGEPRPTHWSYVLGSRGAGPLPRTSAAAGFQPTSSSLTAGWLPHSAPGGAGARVGGEVWAQKLSSYLGERLSPGTRPPPPLEGFPDSWRVTKATEPSLCLRDPHGDQLQWETLNQACGHDVELTDIWESGRK